jgi:hypothetical protein
VFADSSLGTRGLKTPAHYGMAVSSLSASVEAMTWTLCGLWQFSRGISLRKGRADSVTCKGHVRESDLLERAEPTERNIEDPYLPETPHTGRNILKFALKTLSTISSNIPFGSVLSSVIDPLLDIVNRIEVSRIRLIAQLILTRIPANVGQHPRSR